MLPLNELEKKKYSLSKAKCLFSTVAEMGTSQEMF